MRNTITLIILLILVLSAGCGGGGGGLAISGGSIPGGGTIKGLIALPNGQPMTNPVVTVKTLTTQQSVAVTTTYQPNGSFTITGAPTNQNLVVVFNQSSTTLKASVSKSQFTGVTTVDLGTVNAVTTVVAQSVEEETTHSPEYENEIVNQKPRLTTQKEDEGEGESELEQEINSSTALDNAVKTLIKTTANTELAALSSSNTTANAQTALVGLIGYVEVVNGGSDDLSAASFSTLVTAQTAGKKYTPAQIVTALAAAGVTTTTTAVSAADTQQRSALTSFASFGTGITPFEAFVLAAKPVSAGGYGLGSTATTQFVNALP